MGGNPGSSRRCRECRQRKKKCGLEQPSCLRCVKSGSRCSGPGERNTFVHRDASNLHESGKAILNAGFEARAAQRSGHDRSQAITRDGDGSYNTWGLGVPFAQMPDPTNIAIVDGILKQTAIHTLYDSIRAEFSPEREVGIFGGDRIRDVTSTQSMIAISIRMLLQMTNLGIKMLDVGVFALLTKYYGAFTHDSQLIALADSSYVKAIGDLHRTLGDVTSILDQDKGDRNLRVMVFQLCLAMLWFESIDWSPLASTVDIHIKGAISVLQFMDLDECHTMQLHCGVSGLRGMVIAMALRDRCDTLLADPKWRSLQYHDANNIWTERLNDIAIQIPNLLTRFDHLQAMSIPSRYLNDDLNTLIDQYIHLKCELDNWLRDLQNANQEILYWTSSDEPFHTTPIPTAHIDPICRPSFPSTYTLRFKDGAKAGLLARCWSFQLQNLLGLFEIHDLRQTDFSITQVDNDPEQQLAARYLTWRIEAHHLSQMITEAVNYLCCCLEGCIVARAPWEIVTRYNKYMSERSNAFLY